MGWAALPVQQVNIVETQAIIKAIATNSNRCPRDLSLTMV